MKNIFIAFIIGLSIIIGLNFDYFKNDGMTYISEFFYEISGQKAKDIREIKIRVEKLRKEKEIEAAKLAAEKEIEETKLREEKEIEAAKLALERKLNASIEHDKNINNLINQSKRLLNKNEIKQWAKLSPISERCQTDMGKSNTFTITNLSKNPIKKIKFLTLIFSPKNKNLIYEKYLAPLTLDYILEKDEVKEVQCHRVFKVSNTMNVMTQSKYKDLINKGAIFKTVIFSINEDYINLEYLKYKYDPEIKYGRKLIPRSWLNPCIKYNEGVLKGFTKKIEVENFCKFIKDNNYH